MRNNKKIAVTIAAVMSMAVSVTSYARVEEFLTGGSAGQTNVQDISSAQTEAETAPDAGYGNSAAAIDFSNAGTDSGYGASQQDISMVSCVDNQTGVTVARAAVPKGYNVNTETTWCGPVQCPDFPASVFIDAVSPDGSIELNYESPLEFAQLVNASVNGMQFMTHQDWAINPDIYTMMLQYMNASQYCDYLASNTVAGAANMTYVSEKQQTAEELAVLEKAKQDKMNLFNQALAGSPGVVDQGEMTAAERTYRYVDSNTGKNKILVAGCVVDAIRLVETVSSYGVGEANITYIIWSIPARYCLLVDEDRYDEGYQAYTAFCANTTISDQFKEECKKLNQAIMQGLNSGSSLSNQADYVMDTFSSAAGGEDTYTSTEAWDDAILDQNDYTLSSGDSVKVDTSYDYVYEMPDGDVYCTNSALDEPADGTRLYAN